MKINFTISGKTRGFSTSMRGAKGFAVFNSMMMNRERQIQAQEERFVKRAGFYLRSVARNSMKRGRTYKLQQPVRYFDRHTGQFETGYTHVEHRSRSKPPNAPHAHRRGGSGLKFILALPYKGNRHTYVVAPVKFRSKGSHKVNFSIHQKLSKGGTGKMYAPVNYNHVMTKAQMFQRGFNKAMWTWIPVRYRSRPYMQNAIAPTRKKFPQLWYNSRK